jgi:predicted transcriptional regulator
MGRSNGPKEFGAGGKRSTDEIIYKVLELLIYNPGIVRTQIMYKANMSHTQQNAYFEHMQDTQLIILSGVGRWSKISPTKLGIEYYIQKRIEKAIIELRTRVNDDGQS